MAALHSDPVPAPSRSMRERKPVCYKLDDSAIDDDDKDDSDRSSAKSDSDSSSDSGSEVHGSDSDSSYNE